MSSEKPQTAKGYDPLYMESCERALVTLLRGFGTLKDTLRLVGGLVPRYLTPESPPDVPPHAGTNDVDIVLNIQVLSEDKIYKKLAAQLKERGFKRHTDAEGKTHSWQWERRISDSEIVKIEFLRDAGENLDEGRVRAIDGEDISALAMPHVGIVQDWYSEIEITAELLDDKGIATETVRFADVPAFIVLKTIAFDQRLENKDAADLIHVMRYAADNLSNVADMFVARYQEDKHNSVLDKTIDILEKRFCDGAFADGRKVEGFLRDGPVAYGSFWHDPLDTDFEDERILAQRTASAMVSEFVSLVKKGKVSLRENII